MRKLIIVLSAVLGTLLPAAAPAAAGPAEGSSWTGVHWEATSWAAPNPMTLSTPPDPTPVSKSTVESKTSTTAVDPGMYIMNRGRVTIGVHPTTAWGNIWPLYYGENTFDQYGWRYTKYTYFGIGYCIREWYNSGELGWTFKRAWYTTYSYWWAYDQGWNWGFTATAGRCT